MSKKQNFSFILVIGIIFAIILIILKLPNSSKLPSFSINLSNPPQPAGGFFSSEYINKYYFFSSTSEEYISCTPSPGYDYCLYYRFYYYDCDTKVKPYVGIEVSNIKKDEKGYYIDYKFVGDRGYYYDYDDFNSMPKARATCNLDDYCHDYTQTLDSSGGRVYLKNRYKICPVFISYDYDSVYASNCSKTVRIYTIAYMYWDGDNCLSLCTPNWQVGNWSECVNGQQTRTVTDSNNCGTNEGKPATTQSCTINCTSWTYSDWGECIKGQQTRTIISASPAGCTGGNPILIQSCCVPIWQTGEWGECINGTQTRTVIDLNNCENSTGKPETTQSCCVPNWQVGEWSECINGTQTRTVIDLNNCENITENPPRLRILSILSIGGEQEKPATTQSCCVPDWQVGNWSECVNGIQIRTVTDLNNCGTNEGKPATIQSCITSDEDYLKKLWDDYKVLIIIGGAFIILILLTPRRR